jgi:uncharacterized RDD family membrane protein YckC
VRLAGIGYEVLLLGAVLFIAGFLFVGLTHYPARPHLRPVYQSYLALITLAYFVGFWTHGGQTPAMRAWRLRLQRRDGGGLDAGRAVARFLAAALGMAAGGVTLWWAWIDRDGQFLHDRLAGTRLVRLPAAPGRTGAINASR